MNEFKQAVAVKKFVEHWDGHGYEKSAAQPFWLSLLRDVFNLVAPEKIISFEVPVRQGFIDALINDTKTLIEQKSSSVNLDDAEIFLQAKRYNAKNKIHIEHELSIKASEIVAKIYDALSAQIYAETAKSLSDLNKLCIRLVFCLYAESIDIFGKHKIFLTSTAGCSTTKSISRTSHRKSAKCFSTRLGLVGKFITLTALFPQITAQSKFKN